MKSLSGELFQIKAHPAETPMIQRLMPERWKSICFGGMCRLFSWESQIPPNGRGSSCCATHHIPEI